MVKEEAPFMLKERVLDSLHDAAQKPFSLFPLWKTLKPALALVSIVFIFALGMHRLWLNTRKPFPFFTESIKSHTKFLKGLLPVDVASGDGKKIYQWFEGKLDFAVSVPDLSPGGVRLTGARLCSLKERKVAYLVYEKDGHKISVFVMDVQGAVLPAAKKITTQENTFYMHSEKGYHSVLVLKRNATVGHVYVSDLPEEEILKFALD